MIGARLPHALDKIHRGGAAVPLTEASIRELHGREAASAMRASMQSENDIIEVHPDGRREVRFERFARCQPPWPS